MGSSVDLHLCAPQLALRGHRVIGVDSSPDMFEHARSNVPGGEFRDGEPQRLPVADAAADFVVCTLALAHVADLRPVFAEFARVPRPGAPRGLGHARGADRARRDPHLARRRRPAGAAARAARAADGGVPVEIIWHFQPA